MENELKKIIQEFISISIQDLSLVVEKSKLMEFKRKENFISFGQQNNLVGFLKTGLLRSYYYDGSGNEQTTAFIEPNSFFSELKSYQSTDPSERTIEAIQPSEVLVWTSNNNMELRKVIPNWEFFETKYFQKILKDKVSFQRTLSKSSKKEAYKLFVQQYPNASKYAPRQYVASFLAMTPYTLSRIKL